MKQHYFSFRTTTGWAGLLALVLMGTHQGLLAQTTISTVGSYTANNGSGTITFNFQNANTYPVTITSIGSVVNTTSAATFKVWYNTTPVNGAPGVIGTATGWTLAATNSVNSAIGSSTNTVVEPVLTGINLVIPANTTYGLAVSGYLSTGTAGVQRYFTITAGLPTTFTDGGCTLISGANVGYATTIETNAATFTPRGFTGTVTFSAGSLPAVLKTFTVTRQNNDAAITWTTLTEVNTKNFTMQRSANGIQFIDAGHIAAKGTAATYALQDLAIDKYATGNRLYYRLLTTDHDGKTQLSKVVSVGVFEKPGVVWVYPNPFKDQITLQVNSAGSARVVLTLTNAYGVRVKKKEQAIAAGTTSLEIDQLQSLPGGTYLLTIKINNETRHYKLVR